MTTYDCLMNNKTITRHRHPDDVNVVRKFNPGMQVVKKNGKPFSNGEMVATIKAYDAEHIRSVWLSDGSKLATLALAPAPVAPKILSITIAQEPIAALLTAYVRDHLGIDATVQEITTAFGGSVELVLAA